MSEILVGRWCLKCRAEILHVAPDDASDCAVTKRRIAEAAQERAAKQHVAEGCSGPVVATKPQAVPS